MDKENLKYVVDLFPTQGLHTYSQSRRVLPKNRKMLPFLLDHRDDHIRTALSCDLGVVFSLSLWLNVGTT